MFQADIQDKGFYHKAVEIKQNGVGEDCINRR